MTGVFPNTRLYAWNKLIFPDTDFREKIVAHMNSTPNIRIKRAFYAGVSFIIVFLLWVLLFPKESIVNVITIIVPIFGAIFYFMEVILPEEKTRKQLFVKSILMLLVGVISIIGYYSYTISFLTTELFTPLFLFVKKYRGYIILASITAQSCHWAG